MTSRFTALMSLLLFVPMSPFAARLQGQLLSLRLVPQNVTLWGTEASQRFVVLGEYADGLERDVTSQSRFSVSDSEVATVGEVGKVMARANGQIRLTARVGERIAETSVRIEEAKVERPFQFSRDIAGILTRRGCNSSECHGSVKGKGGFKLSMTAMRSLEDYKWIVEGGTYQVLTAEVAGERIPRVNLQEAEKSLLLLKPTQSVPHEGGKRFGVGSSDYETILHWVRQGTPYGQEVEQETAKTERLEVFPQQPVLDAQGSQQLLVTAHLSNGRKEDLTEQALYVSNDPEVVEVTPQGRVKAVRKGETAVLIRAAGRTVSASFGVISEPMPDYPVLAKRNFIDEQVFERLRKLNIIPSELCSDGEFLRRICLDLTGTLPPPHRAREFLASRDPEKRDKLIEILLTSPEYADYMLFRIGEFFRLGGGASGRVGDTQLYEEWLRQSIAENKPYDKMAVERIAAQGFDGPTRFYYDVVPVRALIAPAENIAEQVRVHLGRRLDCARCHDHPFEAWSQDQFWGMAAFYGQMIDVRPSVGAESVVIDYPEISNNVTHPRTGKVVEPRFLDGKVLPESDRADLRMRLAEWMVSHPYFSEATANRVWNWFFGRGLVDPVDDFRSTNPPTHPKLLEALGRDFRDHRHDLKHLIRVIVQSRTYQLSAAPNETNLGDRTNYSHALPRPLEAAVLLDAISQVTEVDEVFVSGKQGAPPGTRAIEILPGAVFNPDESKSAFLEVFARNDRKTLPEIRPDPTLAQALHMLSSSTYTEKISEKGGRLDRLLKSGASDREITEELYLAALSRLPGSEEWARLKKQMAPWPSRRETMEAIVWALISSREFVHNH